MAGGGESVHRRILERSKERCLQWNDIANEMRPAVNEFAADSPRPGRTRTHFLEASPESHHTPARSPRAVLSAIEFLQRMILCSSGHFQRMAQQRHNRLQALFGASLAARQIHHQHVASQSRHAA